MKKSNSPTPAVILLHGLGASSTQWTAVAGILRRRYDVLAPDFPGFGDAPLPSGRVNLGTHQAAVESLATAEFGARPFHLVGTSLGALVAILVAARQRLTVRSVTLVSPPIRPSPPASRETLPYLLLLFPGVSLVGRVLLERSTVGEAVERNIRTLYADPEVALHNHSERVATDVRHLRSRTGRRALRSTLRSAAIQQAFIPGSRIARAASSLTCPVLLVSGSDDKICAADAVQSAMRFFPNARYASIRDAGHVPQSERPSSMADLLIRFFCEAEGGVQWHATARS